MNFWVCHFLTAFFSRLPFCGCRRLPLIIIHYISNDAVKFGADCLFDITYNPTEQNLIALNTWGEISSISVLVTKYFVAMTTPMTVSWIIQQQQQQKHLLVQKKLYGVDINTKKKKKQLERKGAQPLRNSWANRVKGLGQAGKRYA